MKIVILFAILGTLFLPYEQSLACRCIGRDMDTLSSSSEYIFTARLQSAKESENTFTLQSLVKGKGLNLGDTVKVKNKSLSCRFNTSNMNQGETYLLFTRKKNGQMEYNANCIMDIIRLDGESFNLKTKVNSPYSSSYIKVHPWLLSSFFKNKNIQLSLYPSITKKENRIITGLSIINNSDFDLEVLHPSQRGAYTFYLRNSRGNIIAPKGLAKVDPGPPRTLLIKKGQSFNYKVESSAYYPFLTGTAQWGYSKGTEHLPHRMFVTYRPFGGNFKSVTSPERDIYY